MERKESVARGTIGRMMKARAKESGDNVRARALTECARSTFTVVLWRIPRSPLNIIAIVEDVARELIEKLEKNVRKKLSSKKEAESVGVATLFDIQNSMSWARKNTTRYGKEEETEWDTAAEIKARIYPTEKGKERNLPH